MAPKRARRSSTSKYKHIFLFEHGRWGAWVREPRPKGKRRFLGTFPTEKLAARCQDRALIKLQMEFGRTDDDTKLNFDRADYAEDEPLRTTMTTDEFLVRIRGESRGKYKKLKATPCLRKFMAEENQASDSQPSSKRTSETGPKSKKQKCLASKEIVYSSSDEDYNSDEDEDDDASEEEYDFSKEEYNPSEEEEEDDNSSRSEDEDEPEDEDEREDEESDPEDDELQASGESLLLSTPDPVALDARGIVETRTLHMIRDEDDKDDEDEEVKEDEEDEDEMEHGMNVFLFLATGTRHDESIKEFLKTKKNLGVN